MTPREAFDSLNRLAGIAPLRAPAFAGAESVAPTPFRIAAASAAALGLGASAAHEIWRLRGGGEQEIAADLEVAAWSLLSFSLLRLNGEAVPRPSENKPTVAFHRTAGSDFIHLHGGFPHLEEGTLALLNAKNTHESVGAAAAKWNAFALEDALAHMKLCGAVARSAEEWRETQQGRLMADTPPIVLKRIGDAPPLRLEESSLPLGGIKVLDLTRVLAGPTAGRTLASHGADVLGIRAPDIPTIALFDLDTGHGKRSAYLDLRRPADAETLRGLLRDAHVFVDSYRPGALADRGLTPAALAHTVPGIVYLAISCYGHKGPWAMRRGWEQLAQSATGLAMEQGAFMARRAGLRDTEPHLIPAAACDYITGYLAAAGAIAALLRRIREGGSWLVEVSLTATAMWLQSLGRTPPGDIPDGWRAANGLDAYRQSCETEAGRLDFLGPVVRMSKTPPAWRRPPPTQGADKPVWLAH